MPISNFVQCLIIDDEPQAREIVKRYIQQVPVLKLFGECTNAIEALSLLQAQKVDLLFLDINMPQLKGVDFVKALKEPPKIIFTTAYPEYALEGYELEVVDYLLKPIQFGRFLKAVQKVVKLNHLPKDGPSAVSNQDTKPFVYFRSERKMVRVQLDEIFYVESMKDYIKVTTLTGTIITKQSISSLEVLLPDNLFIRTHRSFIVSLARIKAYTAELVDVEGAEIPIGKIYRQAVLRTLAQHNSF